MRTASYVSLIKRLAAFQPDRLLQLSLSRFPSDGAGQGGGAPCPPGRGMARAQNAYAMRRHLVDHHDQLLEILSMWDDGDGKTSHKEFRQGWRVLELDAGLCIPRDVVDELYDQMDPRRTGNIPFEELTNALQTMSAPEPPAPLGTVDEDESGPSEEPSPFSRRPPKRSKRTLPPIVSPADFSPSPRPPDQPWVGEAPRYQPPRRTNLPRLASGGSSTGASSPASSPSVARPGASVASFRSAASGCSSSTSTGLTAEQRAQRRARRERELAAQYERHCLPGFNVPGPGQYLKEPASVSAFKVGAGPSAWSSDEMAQHVTLNSDGRVIDFQRLTSIGDPGKYVSRAHEMGVEKSNATGVSFNSALPQRPIGKRGQTATLPWQMWNGRG